MEGDSGTATHGKAISFLDLFSGIGAMRVGFERACKAMGLMPRCAGFSEIDRPATGIYLRHFPGTPALGEITALATRGIVPHCDILLAGFPCQDASMAGKRLGLEGERGRLFFALADAIRAARPSAFLLENVRGLVSLDGGKALRTILSTLAGLGYAVHHAVLNSRDFGVAQNRPRIYIAGFFGASAGFEFPVPTDSTRRLREVLEEGPVPIRHYLSEARLRCLRAHKARHAAKGNGFGFEVIDPSSDVAGTLLASNWGREKNIIVDERLAALPPVPDRKSPHNREHIRKLTPLEWERLQGLPDGFTAGQVDGHRYRQIGNAVTVPVIRAIARHLLEALRRPGSEARPTILVPDRAAVVPLTLPLAAVEICAGCGGLSTGLERTGGIEVKVACEFDPAAAETLRLNHPGTVVVPKDITAEATKREIVEALGGRRCDLLAGGVPCQSYSIAGLRDPADPRGSLFEHFIEMMRRLSPRVALIENVPGILSMRRPDGTPVMTAIARAFKARGYAAGYRLLNAADFGDPQSRRRVLIFAWREGTMPELGRTHDEHGRDGLPKWRTVRDAIGGLEDAHEDSEAWHVFTRSSSEFAEVLRRTAVGSGASATYREAYHRCRPDLPSPTVKGCNGSVFVHYRHPRLMTPLELARLQSFPDSYRFHGTKGEVLRQIGNAVPVGLAAAAGKAVLGMLGAGVPLAKGAP